MNKKIFSAVILFVVIAGGLWYFWGTKNPSQTINADYKNSTFTVEGRQITLVNGRSETAIAPGSALKTVTQYFGNEAERDLNEDGLPDTAFILTQNSGGSGTFYYVVAALKIANGYLGTNAILLGDRIAPQTTEIRNGQLIVNFADRNPGEPMTAQPSVGVSKYLKVIGTTLVETSRIAAVGERCGGNMLNAPVCAVGYVCTPVPDNHLPFGDVGGTCEVISTLNYTDKNTGITFQYPKQLPTKYISAQDWPPSIAVKNDPFSCMKAGSEIASAGKTEKRIVGTRVYCVTTETQGAAGSIYSLYAYATEINSKTVILTFNARFVQCGNYSEPQKTECQNERASFNPNGVVDNIVKTIQFGGEEK